MDGPQDVIQAKNEYDFDETIGMVRAGSCSFAAPLLSKGLQGMITMEGAPQSHLGILAREYNLPAIMGTNGLEAQNDLVDPDLEIGSEEYFKALSEALDGRTVRLDCSDTEETGTGYIIDVE